MTQPHAGHTHPYTGGYFGNCDGCRAEQAQLEEATKLGLAWLDVEAALPENASLALHKLAFGAWAEAVSGDISVSAATPAAALRALHDRLAAPDVSTEDMTKDYVGATEQAREASPMPAKWYELDDARRHERAQVLMTLGITREEWESAVENNVPESERADPQYEYPFPLPRRAEGYAGAADEREAAGDGWAPSSGEAARDRLLDIISTAITELSLLGSQHPESHVAIAVATLQTAWPDAGGTE